MREHSSELQRLPSLPGFILLSNGVSIVRGLMLFIDTPALAPPLQDGLGPDMLCDIEESRARSAC